MSEPPACPIPNAHRRLEEAHRLWHRAAEAYEDPDEFRTQLNALIQALRNVTFIVQKEQRAIPNFDEWYEKWREIMKEDVVLRWLIEARNRVVKEGDLETRSTATAGIQASWDAPEVVTFEVPPLVPTLGVAAAAAKQDIPEEIRRQGVLTVERRWVADDLPEYELLDALGHCYELLSLLVQDAHRQAGVQMHTLESGGHLPSTVPNGRLPCMTPSKSIRTVHVDLETNEVVESQVHPIGDDPEVKERAKERYGIEFVSKPQSVDPFAWARALMEQAKHVLSIDKYHLEMVFLFDDRGLIAGPFATMPENQQAKYLFLNDVAREVERHAATGVVVIGDSWYVSPDVDIPYGMRPSDMIEERKEALMVTAAKSDGSTLTLLTTYTRDGDNEIVFSDTVEDSGGEVFLFPIMQVWGVSGFSEQEALKRVQAKSAEDEIQGPGGEPNA